MGERVGESEGEREGGRDNEKDRERKEGEREGRRRERGREEERGKGREKKRERPNVVAATRGSGSHLRTISRNRSNCCVLGDQRVTGINRGRGAHGNYFACDAGFARRSRPS